MNIFEELNTINDQTLEEGLHADLYRIQGLLKTAGYSNIVVDTATNKIVADIGRKTYLFELIYNDVKTKTNNRFHVNQNDSTNKNKEVYSTPGVNPTGTIIGKAGVGTPHIENRRQYNVAKVLIWELKQIDDAFDSTTWPK